MGPRGRINNDWSETSPHLHPTTKYVPEIWEILMYVAMDCMPLGKYGTHYDGGGLGGGGFICNLSAIWISTGRQGLIEDLGVSISGLAGPRGILTNLD